MRKLIYIYDALCPWCYAFTPVVMRLVEDLGEGFTYEVLSGGMVTKDRVRPDAPAAARGDFRWIEAVTGVKFGGAFLERMNGDLASLDSTLPAVALAVFRESESSRSQLQFVHAMLESIFQEGADPNDPAMYRRLAEKMGLDPDSFVESMQTDEYRDKARYDFALAKQLRAEAFPRLYLQTAEDYFHLISKGYSDIEQIKRIVDAILEEERASVTKGVSNGVMNGATGLENRPGTHRDRS